MSAESAIHDDFPPPGGHTRAILLIALGILVSLAASIGILLAVFRWQVPNDEPNVPRTFPAPRVLADEAGELKQLLAEQRKQLESYGWVDRDKQIISIPIERAMALVAARADGYAPIITTQQDKSVSPAPQNNEKEPSKQPSGLSPSGSSHEETRP
jgi:hypothetical protein